MQSVPWTLEAPELWMDRAVPLLEAFMAPQRSVGLLGVAHSACLRLVLETLPASPAPSYRSWIRFLSMTPEGRCGFHDYPFSRIRKTELRRKVKCLRSLGE